MAMCPKGTMPGGISSPRSETAATGIAESEPLPSTAAEGSSSSNGSYNTERVPLTLAAIQHVLNAIFNYYAVVSGSSEHKVITAARFNRLLLDAGVIDDKRLTPGKADLVFARICGHAAQPMAPEQFLDAVVQLARTKYPKMSCLHAISRLYCNHFATFSAAPDDEAAVTNLDADTVDVLLEAKPGLQAVYKTYFKDCIINRNAGGSTAMNNNIPLPPKLQSLAQEAWVRVLTDFEVLPAFAGKAMVFAAFREAVQLRIVPEHTRLRLLGGSAGTDIGRLFTYVHFALALVSLSRRCFASNSAKSLVRLLQWMNDSKGSILAATKGHTGMQLRILPQPLSAALAQEPRPPHAVAEDASREPSVKPQSRRRSSSSVVEMIQRSISGSHDDPRSTGVRRAFSATRTGPHMNSVSASVVLSEAFSMLEALKVEELSCSPWAEQLVTQVFSHYAALSDPVGQEHLTPLQFSHFLRDAGLISSEVRRSQTFFDFVPAERVQEAQKHVMGARRSGSSGPVGTVAPQPRRQSRGPRRTSRAQDGATAEAPRSSLGDAAAAARQSGDLPLRVLGQPPLTHVDADMIFIKAIQRGSIGQEPDQQQQQWDSSSSTATTAGRRASGTGATSQRHKMTLPAFLLSVQTVALALLVSRDANEDGAGPQEMLDALCRDLLQPLSRLLLGGIQQEVYEAAALIAHEESLMERIAPGLERIFLHYAAARSLGSKPLQQSSLQQACWSAEDMARCVKDFGLASEVSQRPLQQIFRACIRHSRRWADGPDKEMKFCSFKLVIVVLAQRIHNSLKHSPVDKFVLLMHRFNASAREEGFNGPQPPLRSSLVPGLPALSMGRCAWSQPIQQSTSGGRIATAVGKRLPVQESWAALVNQAEAAEDVF